MRGGWWKLAANRKRKWPGINPLLDASLVALPQALCAAIPAILVAIAGQFELAGIVVTIVSFHLLTVRTLIWGAPVVLSERLIVVEIYQPDTFPGAQKLIR